MRRGYHDEVVRIRDVVVGAGGRSVVEGATFTGCTIIGPAVLVVGDGFDLLANEIVGSPDAFLWEVKEGRPRVTGAVLATRCEFRGCTFKNVGFAGHPLVIARLRAGIEEGQ